MPWTPPGPRPMFTTLQSREPTVQYRGAAMRSVRLITPLAAVLLSAAAARAQTLPTAQSPPRDIAIRNARIVQAAGRVVENGTIVLKNGLITAGGGNRAIPAGAGAGRGGGGGGGGGGGRGPPGPTPPPPPPPAGAVGAAPPPRRG